MVDGIPAPLKKTLPWLKLVIVRPSTVCALFGPRAEEGERRKTKDEEARVTAKEQY